MEATVPHAHATGETGASTRFSNGRPRIPADNNPPARTSTASLAAGQLIESPLLPVRRGRNFRSAAAPVLLITAALSASCSTPDAARAPPPLDEPFRVLLLGDSISMGYTPFVQEALRDRAHVARAMRGAGNKGPENCAGTNNGVQHLDRWLALEGGEWDVIHVNFGLHDLKRVQPDSGSNSNDPNHPHQARPERYETQLRDIVRRLKATGSRVVFATTTPVPAGELRPFRAPADAVTYNSIATRVMEQEGIPVNDLFRFVMESDPPMSRPGDVHFSKDGSRALGNRVAEAILQAAGLAHNTPSER